MCGIAGIFSHDLTVLSRIGQMVETQAHRGPDGAGHLLLGSDARWGDNQAPLVQPGDFLALGHRRLAILDCTSAGAQPMTSNDRKDWITYNGEIYNYLELRKELEEMGFQFVTGTDTEVVLAAYRAWGVSCFKRFNGMWAIALWDGEREQLILSRDRLGIKPLFYSKASQFFLFSSEIKGILATGQVEARLNKSVAVDFLKWSTVNHRHDSFFKGIHSLPPGHFAVVEDPGESGFEPVPFWSLEPNDDLAEVNMETAAAYFSETFRDAVRLRLRSDVPVGSCLSGGLDSSAIVCQANELRSGQPGLFHTFTSGDSDPKYDECCWSDLVVGETGSVSHKVFPSAEGFAEDLPHLLWHQDEPFSTTSIYAQWCIMRRARQEGIPVLLDGQGADEILCGYRKFYVVYLIDLLRRKAFGTFLTEIGWLLIRGDRGFLRWREGTRYLPKFLQSKLANLSDFLTDEGRVEWFDSNVRLMGDKTVEERQIEDLLFYSVPSLLRYEDRNSMAWSIESRVPFLDYRLVEAALSMPAGTKLNKGRAKAVMRAALKDLVPKAVIERRDKMGFVTAQERWMKKELRQVFESRFMSTEFRLGSLVDQIKLQKSFQDFLVGRKALSHNEFFRVFILDAWMERFGVKF